MGKDSRQFEIESLARRAVEATQPGELTFFSATANAYFADPKRAVAVARSKSEDDMLGFGVEAAAVAPAVTTAALWAAQGVLTWIASQVQSAVEEESSGLIKNWVRRVLIKLRIARPESASVVPLSTSQLARVREVAYAKAQEMLPDRDAAAIADALVAGLVLPQPARTKDLPIE